ncbi:PREDICTED: uncharacterized protein LOC108362829 [Rhagoletis zephyria]|uniref:uncharacterized protein LOC108362829 n=1 Tax=Rhagoletis zephyria TaxID=28612 RepID=UPI00081167CE|nr:PREDICTED: uncharacterized protein LOC108362829 [Rhagoletis zephyria]
MCNNYTTEDKFIDDILAALLEELHGHKFINNRYAVVAFGAQVPPFDYPRSISNDYGVFVNTTDKLRHCFNHVTRFLHNDDYHKSNSDILQAISVASRLNFRPGVSKTFILFSCNRCDIKQMLFDFSSILQYMNEEGVRLHILTNTEFTFDKQRKMRNFFGFDKHFVYSHRFPEGESETRHILQISRSGLGICTPLALETGGSIFSRKKIMTERKNSFKRFATIFAKRVVQSAMPIGNQTCECTGHKTGVAYMLCTQGELTGQKLLLEENDLDLSGMDWQSEMDDME